MVLGKAAPDDDDTASLLVQLDRISRQARVDFRGLTLKEGEGETAPPAPAGTPQTPADTAAQDEQRVAAVEAETGTATTAAPTEAQAALLPIGASVGPAGLPDDALLPQLRGRLLPSGPFLSTDSTDSSTPMKMARSECAVA